MSNKGSKSTKSIDAETYVLAQGTSATSTTSFDELDGFEQILALFIMAFSLNNADNESALDNIGDALGDKTYSTYVQGAKLENATPKQAAQGYTKFTSEGVREVAAMPANTFMPKENNEHLLAPDLVAKMQSNPQIAQYVSHALDAAERNGINGSIFANQLWQESKFDPMATSYRTDGRGYYIRDENGEKTPLAMGVGQFIKGTGQQYGLKTEADFRDPFKSIDAAANHMGDLTNKFGDQGLALVGYNGGSRAITHLHEKFGSDISLSEWVSHMEEQRAEYGTDNANKWRVQSFDYLHKINPSFWSDEDIEKSRAAMAELNTSGYTATFNSASNNVDLQQPAQTPATAPAQTPELVV